MFDALNNSERDRYPTCYYGTNFPIMRELLSGKQLATAVSSLYTSECRLCWSHRIKLKLPQIGNYFCNCFVARTAQSMTC